MGGTAPRIDVYGRFAFAHQVLPVNISRAGEYMVRATHNLNGGVVVLRIIVR